MKANSCISIKEHKLLIVTTFCGLVPHLIALFNSIFFPAPKSDIDFGLYSIFDMPQKMSPLYSFFGFLLCSLIVWKINFPQMIFSTFIISLLLNFYNSWFIETRRFVNLASENNLDFQYKTYDHILISGCLNDVFILLLVNILFIWQATILFRMILRYFQSKPALK
jgi:hypothetical protein